jgi:hypothetical protein
MKFFIQVSGQKADWSVTIFQEQQTQQRAGLRLIVLRRFARKT